MVLSKGSVRRILLAGWLASAAAAPALAQQQGGDGLGQSWPQAADLSASPQWHVYVFPRDGIKYIQVSDTAGTIHTAIASAHGHLLVLPMGTDAQRVQTQSATADTSAPAATAETVYADDDTQIAADPQPDGSVQWKAISLDDDGNCDNGRDCGIGHRN